MKETGFKYKEWQFDDIINIPAHVVGCMVILCVKGHARLVAGIEEMDIKENTSIMFFVGTTFYVRDNSDDIVIRLWEIDEETYHEVSSVIPPSFERFLLNMPAYEHKASDLSLQYVQTSMDMVRLLAAEPELPSANQRVRMFAKSYMLYLLDYIRPYIEEVMDKSSVQQQLYRRFISVVYQYSGKERQLSFYASRLCISVRYLSEIVPKYGNGVSPKQLITNQLLYQIKALLVSTDMVLTQIAFQLNFPDQSYLSRFFKRYVGCYPTEYQKRPVCNRKHLVPQGEEQGVYLICAIFYIPFLALLSFLVRL